MVKAVLDKREYELTLDFDAIEFLEEEYNMSIVKLADSIDVKINDFVNYFHAMNKNHEALSKKEVKDKLRAMMENGEYDYKSLMMPITIAFKDSTPFTRMREQAKKK